MSVVPLRGEQLPTVTVEYEITRDLVVPEPDDGWSCIPQPPPGPGWVIHDASSDKKTVWKRFILLPAGARR